MTWRAQRDVVVVAAVVVEKDASGAVRTPTDRDGRRRCGVRAARRRHRHLRRGRSHMTRRAQCNVVTLSCKCARRRRRCEEVVAVTLTVLKVWRRRRHHAETRRTRPLSVGFAGKSGCAWHERAGEHAQRVLRCRRSRCIGGDSHQRKSLA